MTDTGYSSQKTTVQITTTSATTTTSSTSNGAKIGPDVGYIKTIPGILRIVEIVLNFICIICASVATGYWGNGFHEAASFFEFVAVVGFIWTLVFFFLYFLKIVYVVTRVPWLIIDLILCAVWVVLYVIASIVAATKGGYHSSMAAAAFFGFCCVVVFGINAFFLFRDYRSGSGMTSTNVQSAHTDTKPPAY